MIENKTCKPTVTHDERGQWHVKHSCGVEIIGTRRSDYLLALRVHECLFDKESV